MEYDYREQVLNISDSEWNKLFEFIPEFEKAKDFGKWSDNTNLSENVSVMPYFVPAPIVSDFVSRVYDIGLVLNFDWIKWRNGQELLRNHNTNFDVLDKITLCKLLTMIVRAGRFSEGYLLCCFEDGCILKLLRSLKKKINLYY